MQKIFELAKPVAAKLLSISNIPENPRRKTERGLYGNLLRDRELAATRGRGTCARHYADLRQEAGDARSEPGMTEPGMTRRRDSENARGSLEPRA